MHDGAMVRIGESVRLCHRYAVIPAQKCTKCVNPGVYLSTAHHRIPEIVSDVHTNQKKVAYTMSSTSSSSLRGASGRPA
jgi:hypothetical protein